MIGFLLIVSPAYYDRYEHVLRNFGFAISTVLLRLSLSTPKPYDVALALIAMLYGLALARGVRLLRRDRAQGGHSSHDRCCRSSGADRTADSWSPPRRRSTSFFDARPVLPIHGTSRSARRDAHAEARLKAKAKTAAPAA